MKTLRIGLIVVNLLLITVLVLLYQGGNAQQLPAVFNQDPNYWYGQYVAEQARATGLEESGTKAINGLTASLNAANDTIQKQNNTIVRLVKERNGQIDRAVKAETALAPVQQELDKAKGKTWAGKALRKVRDGAAVVGGIVIAGIVIKLTVP